MASVSSVNGAASGIPLLSITSTEVPLLLFTTWIT